MSTELRYEVQLHIYGDEEDRALEIWENIFYAYDTAEWWREPSNQPGELGLFYLSEEGSFGGSLGHQDRAKQFLLSLRHSLGRDFESEMYVYYVEQVPSDVICTDSDGVEWDWIQEDQASFMDELEETVCAEPGDTGVDGPTGPHPPVTHNPHTVITRWLCETETILADEACETQVS